MALSARCVPRQLHARGKENAAQEGAVDLPLHLRISSTEAQFQQLRGSSSGMC